MVVAGLQEDVSGTIRPPMEIYYFPNGHQVLEKMKRDHLLMNSAWVTLSSIQVVWK